MSIRVVAAISRPYSGVDHARFLQPFEALAPDGFELRTLGAALRLTRGASGYELEDTLLDGAQMLVFPQMLASPRAEDGTRVDVVGALCRGACRRGIPIVLSVDDAVDCLEPANPAYDVVRDSIENVDRLLDESDAYFVSTEALARRLEGRGKPVHVLPNAIDPKRWTRSRPATGEPRVGWAGSASHLDDLLMWVPAVRELQRRLPCRLVLYGLTDTTIAKQRASIRAHRGEFSPTQQLRAEKFLELAELLDEVDFEHVPFQELEGYFATLPGLGLHVGACPLVDTAFNRHKSALKFYEYAAAGIMTVASRVEPYESEVDVTVTNERREWSETMEHYLRSDEARSEVLERQRTFVFEHRNVETISIRWAEAIRSVLASASARPVPA